MAGSAPPNTKKEEGTMFKHSAKTDHPTRIFFVAALLLAVFASTSATAAVVRLDPYDAGTLRPRGSGLAASATSFVGPIWVSIDDDRLDPGYRNYFKFDLSSVREGRDVTEAYLLLEFPSGAYDSKLPRELLTLHDVTSDPHTYGFDFSNCSIHGFSRSVWEDLGDGASYGSRYYRLNDEGTTTRIRLNASAIADINAAIAGDGEFAIGGTLTRKTTPGSFPTLATDADWILLNTGHETDLCFGTPSGWTTRKLVLRFDP